MKVTITRLDNNTSETVEMTLNKKGRPSYVWNGAEHILTDRTYPAEYTFINSEKPLSDKFKFKVSLEEGSERELHEIWNKIQNTPVKK